MEQEYPNHMKLTKKEEKDINRYINSLAKIAKHFLRGALVGLILIVLYFIIKK